MHDFKAFKKNRKANLAALKEKLNDTASGKKKYAKDERYWEPTVDKNQNGSAIIRFLPSPQGPTHPAWVQLFSHGFQGPTGQWYIENSRTTLGEADPLSELNTELWNAGDKDTARAQKRKLHFISNVLIIKDPGNPENEGRVMLFKYGKKIFEKLNDAMNPEFDNVEEMNPFDMEDGCDFNLRIRKYEGYRNYDKSGFSSSTPIGDTEEAMAKIYKQTYDLDELVADDQFKSYDVLAKRLNLVLALGVTRKPSVKEEIPTDGPPEVGKEETASPSPAFSDNTDFDGEEDLDAILEGLEAKAE